MSSFKGGSEVNHRRATGTQAVIGGRTSPSEPFLSTIERAESHAAATDAAIEEVSRIVPGHQAAILIPGSPAWSCASTTGLADIHVRELLLLAEGLVATAEWAPECREWVELGVSSSKLTGFAASVGHPDNPLALLIVLGDQEVLAQLDSARFGILLRVLALKLGALKLEGVVIRHNEEAARFADLAAFAHDVAKQLRWLVLCADRLGSRFREHGVPREVGLIRELAEDLMDRVGHLLRRENLLPDGGAVPLGTVLRSAVRNVERVHGVSRVLMPPALATSGQRVAPEVGTVVENLLANAIEASPSSGQVRLDCQVSTTSLTIRVQDHGAGMSRQTVQQAMIAGFSTKGRSPGRGLGLATSRAIVGRLGGELAFVTEEGAGTTAVLRLPAGC